LDAPVAQNVLRMPASRLNQHPRTYCRLRGLAPVPPAWRERLELAERELQLARQPERPPAGPDGWGSYEPSSARVQRPRWPVTTAERTVATRPPPAGRS